MCLEAVRRHCECGAPTPETLAAQGPEQKSIGQSVSVDSGQGRARGRGVPGAGGCQGGVTFVTWASTGPTGVTIVTCER